MTQLNGANMVVFVTESTLTPVCCSQCNEAVYLFKEEIIGPVMNEYFQQLYRNLVSICFLKNTKALLRYHFDIRIIACRVPRAGRTECCRESSSPLFAVVNHSGRCRLCRASLKHLSEGATRCSDGPHGTSGEG